MNMIINNIAYSLIKKEQTDSYVEYEVFKGTNLLGKITKCGAEIFYTARDKQGEIKGCAATLRDTLESMVLHIFYSSSYKGEKYIKTLGAWIEGEKVHVEYERNGFVKHTDRVVRYSKDAGDLYVTLDNQKYFYCEFE